MTGGVTPDQLEPAVLASVAGDSTTRGEVLDALVAALLAKFKGHAPRSTDGVVIMREELGATSYFAVGTLFMIADQSRLPVAIEIAWAPGGGRIETARVRVGIAADASRQRSYGRLESALLAYPREAAAEVAWANVFERDARGWREGSTPSERS
jgi:hypothetical protein